MITNIFTAAYLFLQVFMFTCFALVIALSLAVVIEFASRPMRHWYLLRKREQCQRFIRVSNERIAKDQQHVKYLRPYVGRDLK